MDLDKKLTGIPIVDQEVSEEILNLLIDALPNDLAEIKLLNAQGRFHELTQRVHKLHGAVCYCGTPRLKIVLNHIETQLKNNIMDDLPHSLDLLSIEIDSLLDWF